MLQPASARSTQLLHAQSHRVFLYPIRGPHKCFNPRGGQISLAPNQPYPFAPGTFCMRCLAGRLNTTYKMGTTNRVNSVPILMPPTMTTPI